jgi:hypothetical protein
MKLRHASQAVLCTLSLFAMASPAAAANTASIAMSPLGYTLEDLAPDDGIAPELTWLSRQSEAVMYIYEDPPLNPPSDNPYQSATGTTEPGTVSLSQRGAIVSVSPTGSAIEVKIPSGSGTEIQAVASELSQFTLTPNTRVHFFADAVAEVELDLRQPAAKYMYRGIAAIEQGGHDGTSWGLALDRIFANDLAPKVFGTHTLSWSASNSGGESAVLSVNPRLRVTMDNMAVVPEPAALAQVLAGLVPLAIAVRMRRRPRPHMPRG